MSIHAAIREAEALLPGKPTDGQDPRWQAIIGISNYVDSQPEAIWQFVRQWGCHEDEDLRDAVAICLLEHLLEYHFTAFFPRVEQLAHSNKPFADTFLRCSKFGQSEELGNAERFDSLKNHLSLIK
jgi:hypothetical protein